MTALVLILALAFAGTLIAYQRASYRADRAERARDRYRARAAHYQAAARRWRHDAVDTKHFAAVPGDPSIVQQLDWFLDDLLPVKEGHRG